MKILRASRSLEWFAFALLSGVLACFLGLILLVVASWLTPHLPPLNTTTPLVAQLSGAQGTLTYEWENERRIVITEFTNEAEPTIIGVTEGSRPVWSPDGAQLAYVDRYFDPQGQQQLGVFTIAVPNGQPRLRAPFSTHEIRWSPDGKTIAFLTHNRSTYVFLLDITTEQVIEVPVPQATTLASLTWSPDSQYLAFQAETKQKPWAKVMLLDTQTQQVRVLAAGGEPSWAPDSTRLVYTGEDGNIYTNSIAGGWARQLIRTPELEGAAQWSPDGASIAFLGRENQNWFGEPAWEDIPTGLYVMELDTGIITPLTGRNSHIDRLAGWSPDGTLLAVEGSVGIAYGLYLIAVDGSGAYLLDADGADAAWRP